MSTAEELLEQARASNEAKEYNKVIDLLTDEVLQQHKSASLYYSLGVAYGNLKNYTAAIKAYNKAIETEPKFFYPYNGLGIVYMDLKNYDEAIKSYNKAIELNPEYSAPYYNIGIVYWDLKKMDEVIKACNKAIELDTKFKYAYYYRALAYYDLERYEEARKDYEQYIELTASNPDTYTQYAKERIEEIKKLLKNVDYRNISELVNKIKDLLLHKDGCVTHHTGFSTAQKLILDKSNFRLSEGTFLNDTAEGRELFDFLDFHTAKNLKDTEAKPFAEKPFIGSFVAEEKHDDLALWRMYGKENKEEAKGCAITIHATGLVEGIRKKLFPQDKSNNSMSEDDLRFYRVAYKTPENAFIIPGAKSDEPTLNDYLKELTKEIKTFNSNLKKIKEGADTLIKNVLELLNSIAYLFKSAEYQYEHELRLVVKRGIGFEKNIEYKEGQLKVFIELVEITPYIRKITFGPKVERREEWAAIFYYTLEKSGFKPDIYISHLPFK